MKPNNKVLALSLVLASGIALADPAIHVVTSNNDDDVCNSTSYCVAYQFNNPAQANTVVSSSLATANLVTKSGAIKTKPVNVPPMTQQMRGRDTEDSSGYDDMSAKFYLTNFTYTVSSINGQPLTNCVITHDLINKPARDIIQFNQDSAGKITCNIIVG